MQVELTSSFYKSSTQQHCSGKAPQFRIGKAVENGSGNWKRNRKGQPWDDVCYCSSKETSWRHEIVKAIWDICLWTLFVTMGDEEEDEEKLKICCESS